MSNNHDRYLTPAGYASPRSPYQIPNVTKVAAPTNINMTRSSSYDPHRVLGYFDIPSRSVPSSPQTSSLPFSPSRSSSPARDIRKSRELNPSHSGSDLEDALVGFSLVPNWLKVAMEQDHNTNNSSTGQKSSEHRPHRYSPLNSPDSLMTTSNETSPATPRTPQLNLTIPKSKDHVSSPQDNEEKMAADEAEDQRYWAEEDEGYWGEMEEYERDEELEECYRSVL